MMYNKYENIIKVRVKKTNKLFIDPQRPNHMSLCTTNAQLIKRVCDDVIKAVRPVLRRSGR